jgi:hypothetical protein
VFDGDPEECSAAPKLLQGVLAVGRRRVEGYPGDLQDGKVMCGGQRQWWEAVVRF